MRSISSQLAAHYASGSRTLARCWRIERKDGVVFCLTSCAFDLLYLGEVYRAKEGLNPNAIEQTADGAVPNSEMTGVLSSDLATEQEILAGAWDGAQVSIFEVNFRDLTMGHLIIGLGTLGGMEVGRLTFKAEYRGLAQALQLTTGRTYSPICMTDLGSSECKVDVESMRVTSTVTAVTDRRTFSDSANIEADDWFGAGVVTFSGGDLDGFSMEVYSYDGAGNFQLVLPMPVNIPVGQAYSVIPGCRKRHERGARNPLGVSDCVDKFNNVINFRGFPPSQFPGNNRILGLGSNASTSFNP